MILFGIVITLGLLFSAYLIYMAPEPPKIRVPVVCAGDADSAIQKPLSSTIQVLPDTFTLDGQTIQTREYNIFVVNGDSMKNRDIHSGDIVLSKPVTNVYTDLAEHNVIVLRIANRLGSYKLREFIKVVTVKDYDNSRDDILKSLANLDSEFPAKLDKCIAQYREVELVFIISKTFDVEKQYERYSIHPVSLLEGRVYYKIDPKDL